MKVLIIGSGGREHALAWQCAQFDEVELLRVGSSGGKGGPSAVWKRKGHGMVWQQGYTLPGLTLAMGDLGSDGQVETLFCGENEKGNATLAAVRADGSVFWEHAFHGIGTDGVYSGLSRWFVGDFVGDSSPDVGVVHNRVRGANEMTVLEGNTGRAIWTTKPFMAPGSTQSVAIGGPPVSAVYDFNQDGKDDISYMPVWFTLALSGRSGQWLNGRYVTDIYPRTLNYPYLFLTDVTGDGSMEILLHGPYMHTMAQTYESMQMLWFREFEGNTSNFFPPAVSDVDHDGIKELGMPGEDGVFRCIRASDGAVIWQEDLGLPGYSNVGAADVDGNGVEDYFYYSRSGSLVVVRGALKPGEKRLLWQLPIGPLVGGRQHPIFVDTDADGSGDNGVALELMDDIRAEPGPFAMAGLAVILGIVAIRRMGAEDEDYDDYDEDADMTDMLDDDLEDAIDEAFDDEDED